MELVNFPFAWHCTTQKYAVFPEAVLTRIIPQEPKAAGVLFDLSFWFLGKGGLAQNQFQIKQIKAEPANAEDIHAWLLSCHRDEETSVYLSWQPDTAVVTTWGIFGCYWAEFCCTALDDLLVWPENGNWVLFYHHEEFMQYGERRLLTSE